MMDEYDAGYLNDYGGGNVDWWQDYMRAEIGRANEFCAVQYATLAAENAALKADLAAANQARAVAEANLELRSMSNVALRQLIGEMVEGLELVVGSLLFDREDATSKEVMRRVRVLIARAKGATA